jgi:hypothetical protein
MATRFLHARESAEVSQGSETLRILSTTVLIFGCYLTGGLRGGARICAF